MIFSSPVFLFYFLPLFLICYFLLPQKNLVLLVFSLFFHDGGNHTSFAFDLVGAPAVNFSAITGFGSGFTSGGPSSFGDSPFGNFEYGLSCNCDQGNDADVPGPLHFTIKPTNNTTVLALDGHTTAGYPQIFAAADLRNTNPGGSTGAIGAVLVAAPEVQNGVPEPGTWAMLILGMGMVGGALRMRRRDSSAGVNA